MAFRTNKTPVLQEKSASGSVATFNTALAMPLPSCNIALTATQSGSGTPSPDNVRTINGYSAIHIQNTCGINQWDEVWENGTINPTTGENEPNSAYIRSKNYIRITPNTNYFYKTSATLRLVYYDINKAFVGIANANNAIVLSPANAYYVRFYPNTSSYGSTYKNDISINFPSTDTSYHAFVGQSVTIQIGSTVYGGYYDARTGVLTVTHEIVDLATLTWIYQASSHRFRTMDLSDVILPPINRIGCFCSHLDTVSFTAMDTTPYSISSLATTKAVFVNAPDYTTVEDFVVAFSGAMLVYPLETPQTIQLPPCPIDTLQGVNNIWADTGDIDLTFKDLDIAKRGSFREVFRLPS